ncbi:MAG: hypothetical protein RLZZ230_869, partial [Candidatus Parcubacteria bacterium]
MCYDSGNMQFLRTKLDPNTIVLFKQIGVGLVVIATVALIITGIWYGSRIESLTISQIEVSGGETINHEELKSQVEKVLEGEYLGLIPRRFAWLYPDKEIVSALTSVERIHNIAAVRTSGAELKVTFDEYLPQALWCQATEQPDCLFLDQFGYAFGHAPQLTGGSFLRFVKSGEDPAIGTTVTTPESLANLLTLVNLLAEHNWYISYVEIDQVNDVFLKVSGGGELKVMAATAPEKTVDNLLVILSSDEFA